jgi:predicted amidophosphoribosyltransferase
LQKILVCLYINNETVYSLYNDAEFIIPGPLNIVRRIKRGYNQGRSWLANEISIKAAIPILKNALFRKKITKAQLKLSKLERAKNIKDSFSVKNIGILKGKSVILIDDIAAISVTVLVCSLALKTAIAKKMHVLTLARD